MTTMIYHAPYALNPQSVSASAIRPIQMLDAFRSLGIEVLDITGYATERRKRWRAVKRRIEAGQRIDFMYSETATIPAMVTEPRHVPPHFFLDLGIIRYCHTQGIPVGVFYRDVYWKFDEYDKRVGQPLAALMKAVYRYEITGYNRWCSRVYLPSVEMAKYLPPADHYAPLPPGGEIVDATNTADALNVFYIGGIGGHYRLHNLLEAVKTLPQVQLTVCTDRARWESVRQEYPQADSPNISIVHKSGKDRDELYRWATVCYVAMDPEPYGAFASPVKLYEYITRGKPILATDNTLVSRVVHDNEIGWSTPNDVDSIRAMLQHLEHHPQEVARARIQCEKVRQTHTWQARARQVVTDLTGLAP